MNVVPLIAESPRFLSAIRRAQKVAKSSANVLITGESGTGKEVIARMIHEESDRKPKLFVPINCSAVPENLMESEFFGHARGAFTGAHAPKQGLFEESDGGTLFLDEIGDLDLHLQAKILRVLQERKVKRVGENHYRNLNLRILAATNVDLSAAVMAKSFREDLYYRLKVVSIEIPPLRERSEDIIPLARYFVDKFSKVHKINSKELSVGAQSYLLQRSWAGNVRELENTIERALILGSGPVIEARDLEDELVHREDDISFLFQRMITMKGHVLSLEELNQAYIDFVLSFNKGAREKSSRDLGIDRKTLYRKIQDRSSHFYQ